MIDLNLFSDKITEESLKIFKDLSFSFKDHIIVENNQVARYSVEVNFRTTQREALDNYAKIVLGYVSAALKGKGFHTKHIYEEKPLRLLVSTRNWDDGEWCGLITWNHEKNIFVISKGFYNKSRKTISVISNKETGDSAVEITKDLNNMMNHLKSQPDKHIEKLKAVNMKRGPKG
jgi:hypothetical protein